MRSARASSMRESRRAAQFAKFQTVYLNLTPLVDTLIAVVFFALTTATVGELAPILGGVSLPESRVGAPAHQQLTLGIASQPAQISFNGRPLMSVQQAAAAVSSNAGQPLLVPALYDALKASADSIRRQNNLPADQSVDTPLAIQGDKTMRYDLLQRVLQTARLAGFKTLTLQVRRAGLTATAPASS